MTGWAGRRGLCSAALGAVLAAGLAAAQSPNIVVSQVYGGGGNAGATLTHDFIELFNRGVAAVDVTGWSVQYASASGTTWQVTALAGTIEPGRYYLVQQAAGGGGTEPLPTPDAIGNIAMSAASGKVALVSSTTALAGSCPTAGVVDLVGYGAANCYEGAGTAPGLTNTTAALRNAGGCTDTDNNNADFTAAAPAPRNSASPPNACSGPPLGACCVGVSCSLETELDCQTMGGTWHGGIGCDSNPCGAPTGACCVAYNCTIDTQQNCVTAGGSYQGDGTACGPPNPCLACSTIAEARALPAGLPARLCNVVVATTTDLVASAASRSFTLQDASGGLTVFGATADIDALLAGLVAGDSITLEGKTGTYNGLAQLVAPLALVTSHGFVGVPAPTPVTAADFADGSPTAEALESTLVTAECVLFLASGTFAAATNYTVVDAQGSFTVRVATGELDLVGQPIPGGWVSVTGVFSQFDSSFPYDGGYQLLPLRMADIVPNPGCGDPLGACCVGQTCSLATQVICETNLGGTYQGDLTTCTPDPCTCEGVGAAKAAGPGVPVRLCDVTVSSTTDLIASGSSKCFQVQDATGGITVFGTNAAIDAVLGPFLGAEGSRITLEGTTEEYNGLFELVAPFRLVAYTVGGPLPAPVVLTAADFADGSPSAEVYESMLVTVECVSFAAGGGTFAVGNYPASDATGSLVVRVATSDLDLIGQPIPTGQVNVTGILSQFDTSDPRDGGYQLLVRSMADLVPDEGCPDASGACCTGASCSIQSEAYCVGVLGGTWQGPGTGCAPNPCIGACCAGGGCTLTLPEDCTGDWLGYGTECGPGVCPAPVAPGDVALGLSQADPLRTVEHIRTVGATATKIGSWSSQEFLQSMEFDNAGGTLHNASGNLLAMSFGAAETTDGKLFNLATNGTNASQLLFHWNGQGGTDPDFLSRTAGLSVSPDNAFVAAWGATTGYLYVLGYDAGPAVGTGSGAAITGAWVHRDLITAGGTQGTAWYDAQTILTYNTSFDDYFTYLYAIGWNPVTHTFTQPPGPTVEIEIPVPGGGSQYTDVEYNPAVCGYVFCLHSDYTAGVSTTTLTVVDPGAWMVVRQIDLSASCDTGREIALGPGPRLYIAQYDSRIDTLALDSDGDGDVDAGDIAALADGGSVNYYRSPTFATHPGLDVALGGGPRPCPGDFNCDGQITFDDIDPFVVALASQTCCDPTGANCDVNGDGRTDFGDIDPFVVLLAAGTQCP